MIVSLITGILNLNFWFSYILFLIIIGGILILFIYITRIASNEKFKFPKKLILIIRLLIITIRLFLFIDIYFIYFDRINCDRINQEYGSINFSINNFFNMPNLQILILLIIYLLLTLIIAAKITKNKIGPIRAKS